MGLEVDVYEGPFVKTTLEIYKWSFVSTGGGLRMVIHEHNRDLQMDTQEHRRGLKTAFCKPWGRFANGHLQA